MVFQAARTKSGDSVSQPLLMTSASASSSIASTFSDSDIEGGYSSHEEHDSKIVSKFFGDGRMTRRLSQCAQLSFRQRTVDLLRPSNTPIGPVECDDVTATMSSNQNDPPKSIQFYPSREQQNSSSCSKKYTPLALLVAGIGSILMLCLQYSQLSSLRQELEITNQHRRYVEKTRSDLLIQLANREQSLEDYRHTHDQMRKLNQDMSSSMRKMRRDYEANTKELERLRVAEKRADFSEGRWDKYVERIRNVSRRRVLEKFGKGPHHVELRVQLPAASSPETIKIELAPLNMMPHSVHTFLQQVDRGAWDGAAFDANHGHVLMARGPGDRGAAESGDGRVPPPTVLFPEYHSQYPHDKYTLAFPGRPTSSPDFYINLQPNIVHHSPRIDDEEFVEGEPCFGKIVNEDSRRVVDRMDGLSVGNGGRLEEGVVIMSARIIGS